MGAISDDADEWREKGGRARSARARGAPAGPARIEKFPSEMHAPINRMAIIILHVAMPRLIIASLLAVLPAASSAYMPAGRAPVLRHRAAPRSLSPSASESGFEEAVLEEELGGAELNEELRVTVSYSSGAQGRASRVRRTPRPPLEELWRQSSLRLDATTELDYRRMSAYCNSACVRLEDAISLLERERAFSAFGEKISIVSYADVVHARFSTTVPGDTAAVGEEVCETETSETCVIYRDAFLFPYGSVVLWGFSDTQELHMLSLLDSCTDPILVGPGVEAGELADSEFMLYRSPPAEASADAADADAADADADADDGDADDADGPTTITNNVIRLRTDDPQEQLAISFAFAQSAKLSVLEASLAATTDQLRSIPETLSETGRCAELSAKRIGQLTGRVFLERNEANLYSNILDCPDFFWEAESFEPLYRRVNTYLDVEARVAILNNRLDIVNDLLESLSSQLEIRNSHRLEIIIIVLIALEIALSLATEGPPLLSAVVKPTGRLALRLLTAPAAAASAGLALARRLLGL